MRFKKWVSLKKGVKEIGSHLCCYLLVWYGDGSSIFLHLIFYHELALTEQLQLLAFHLGLQPLVLDEDLTLQC